MYFSSLFVTYYYSPLPWFILLSKGKSGGNAVRPAAHRHFGVFLSILSIPFLFLFLEARVQFFCTGCKDCVTPVVTADRFKCHLRKGVVRKAVVWILAGSRSWLDIAGLRECLGRDQKVSVLWSDAYRQQEQCFLEKWWVYNRNLHKQVCCPVKIVIFFLFPHGESSQAQPHPQWGTMTRNILSPIWKGITGWHRISSKKISQSEFLALNERFAPRFSSFSFSIYKNLHFLGGGGLFVVFVCLFRSSRKDS